MSDKHTGNRNEIITMGESLAVFAPGRSGCLRYIRDYEMWVAGAESNVAIGVCKLGHKAAWISKLGDDELGETVLHSVRAEGVDVSAVTRSADYQTGVMVKQICSGSETSVFYYRQDSAASHMCLDDLDYEGLKQASIIHLTGITAALSKGCRELVLAVSEFANKHGIMFSFDPNIRMKLWGDRECVPVLKTLCERADILLTGVDEAAMIFGKGEIQDLIKTVFSSGRLTYLGLKDGERGAYAADADGCYQIPPYPCRCIDPVGAGDAFDAAFLCGVLEGQPVHECGRMGAAAGAFATETNGDTEGYPDKRQLEEAIRGKIDRIYR